MPGTVPLGDLVVTLKLDDSSYKQQVAAAMTHSTAVVAASRQRSIQGASSEFQALDRIGKLTITAEKAKSAAIAREQNLQFQMQQRLQRQRMAIERDHARAIQDNIRWEHAQNRVVMDGNARFGVFANSVSGASTAMHLLTGQSGFMAIELGRTALYLGRASVAAREAGGALIVLRSTLTSFLAAAGPWVPILLAIGAAYLALSYYVDKTVEKLKKQATEEERLAKTLGTRLDIARELALIQGRATTEEVAASTFTGEGQSPSEAVRTARLKTELSVAQRLKDLSLSLGTGRASDFMSRNDPLYLLQLAEDRERRKRELDNESKGTTFGTISSAGFRFGAGARGSAIGEQTEVKETNKKLDELKASFQRELEEIQRTNRILLGVEPTLKPSSNAFEGFEP